MAECFVRDEEAGSSNLPTPTNSLLDYYASNGSDTPALHDGAKYGYVGQGGTWSGWYGDLMKQHAGDPHNGGHVGISYLDWRSGTTISR